MTPVLPIALNLLQAFPFRLRNEYPAEEKGESPKECEQPEGRGSAQGSNKRKKGYAHQQVGSPVRKSADARPNGTHSCRENLRTHQPEARAKTERKRHDIDDKGDECQASNVSRIAGEDNAEHDERYGHNK